MGYRQEDISKIVGISRVQHVNIESGRNSTGVYHIAIVLQVLGLELPKIQGSEINKLIKEQEKNIR